MKLRSTFFAALLLCAAMLCAAVLGACGGSPRGLSDAEIQAIAADTSYSSKGDAAAGQEVFTRCQACHHPTEEKLIGPGLAGVLSPTGPTLPAGVNYGGKLPNGKNRTETNVAAWIRNGGQGKIGVMAAQQLTDQELANLMAYLRTLTK